MTARRAFRAHIPSLYDGRVGSRYWLFLDLSGLGATRSALPSAKLRRGMPEQVPLLLIARLAVDAEYRRKDVGSALLAYALKRCLAASEIAGARAVIAHAIEEAAVSFYERHRFIRSPLGEPIMLMPIETIRSLIGK